MIEKRVSSTVDLQKTPSTTSFDELYTTKRGVLIGWLMKLTGDYDLSEDLVQQAFTLGITKYGEQNLTYSLVARIVFNLNIDHARRKNRITFDTSSSLPMPFNYIVESKSTKRVNDRDADPEQALDDAETIDITLRNLYELAPHHCQTLDALIQSDGSTKEAASFLDITPNAAKSRIFRMRKALDPLRQELHVRSQGDPTLPSWKKAPK